MEIRDRCMRVFSIMITLLLLYNTTNINAKGYKMSNKSREEAPQVVPCFFIFGDSLVDNGNNNYLLSTVKANFWPYGIDFPQGATGRFNNGRTIVDVFAELLGFSNYIPPYAKASSKEFITGVNFASGAAGIRNESGSFLGINVPLSKQIGNFRKVVEGLWKFFKEDTKVLQNHISKCIYYFGLGSNDYLNNYFRPLLYPSSRLYNPNDYANELIQEYSRQLKGLYVLGVRKVIIAGIGPMGCIPNKRENITITGERLCDENENDVIKIFNSCLQEMVDNLNSDHELPDAHFVYLDNFKAFLDLTSNKEDYGFEIIDKACCGEKSWWTKNFSGGRSKCLPLLNPCKDRNKYLFWDGYHPSEVAHMIVGNKAYYESNIYTHPITIKQLAEL